VLNRWCRSQNKVNFDYAYASTFYLAFALLQQNYPTRHQSRPDGMLVTPIEGKGRYLNPKHTPPRDRDIHLVFCSDMNSQQTLGKAHNQHLPLIQRLRTRILRGVSQDNKVTLHISYYTPWSQGHNLQSVHYNSSKPGHFSAQITTSYCITLPCNKKLEQDHKSKTTRPILISLCCFLFFVFLWGSGQCEHWLRAFPYGKWEISSLDFYFCFYNQLHNDASFCASTSVVQAS
jgi:hypothetical protein